jgi:hypothetical protein
MALGGWRIIWDRKAHVPALHRTIIREKLPVIMPFLFKYVGLSKEDSERDIETVHSIWLPSDDRAEDEMSRSKYTTSTLAKNTMFSR